MKVITIQEGSNTKVILQESNASGGGSSEFDGDRVITSAIPEVAGLNPGTSTVNTFLNAIFYPSQAPTAALTLTFKSTTSGSNRTLEFDGGTTESATMNWTAGRQATTDDLATITADGVSQTFTNPAVSSTVAGTQAVSFPSNADKTLTLSVVTSDSKTATDSISVNYRWKQYLGFVATTNPNNTTIQALTNSFITSPSFDGTVVNGGGSQYFAIVFPLSLEPGGGVTVKLGGFDITSDFTRSTFTFTNASGGSSTHVLLISNNQTSGNYTDLEIIS